MNIFSFNLVSTITILISLASVIGVLLGSIKYKGVGLGIGGVLFGGIAMGWAAVNYNWISSYDAAQLNAVLHYVQEFGLILFVYTIGIQVGPGFFASLKGTGLKLIGYAMLIGILGSVIAISFNLLGFLDLDVAVGIYSGAVTNTPALGAASSMIGDIVSGLQANGQAIPDHGLNKDVVSSAYAIAYPFGICGIIITMLLIRFVFGVVIDKEGELYELQKKSNIKDLNSMNVVLKNASLVGKKLNDVKVLEQYNVICSRLKRGESLMVPQKDTVLESGDVLHIVGNEDVLVKVATEIGEKVEVSLSTKGSDFISKRIVVTNNKILGKSLAKIEQNYPLDVVISRMTRIGVEFIPHSGITLQFGDQLNLVGKKSAVDRAATVFGNSSVELQKVHMLPVFIGLVLGMLLGAVAIPVPGLPAALKLGLAGGPLVVAIILSRYGHVLTMNKINWFMPASGNSALREIGIILFLAIVGFNAGKNGFIDTLFFKGGYVWMAYGVFVTLIPIMIAGVCAYKFSRINYLSVCGMLSGAMTDPPALAYANSMYKNSEATALAYATVYPFTMCLRILTPQLMILLSLAVLG